MIEEKFKIVYSQGLQARPATKLVSKANSFQAEMYMEYNDRKVNLKSIMGVLSLGVPANSKVKISVSGSDEDDAFKAISRIITEINEMV
ncbi:MAG: HPr family phosphocarrier protein [Candidatus Izemoplasmatales bacterium]|uniref:HPr family phosphocarrier protein n=1 Tax=Hujiaoplasma nucleasis TaxID=2725268 RepID=UPI002898A334|nr:HPr family phosphocarrier protein [Hujiaoplasma nucleasis]